MLTLTLTFAAWWIPLAITIIWLIWAIGVMGEPSTGWFDLTPLFIVMSLIIPLVAWLIYFIVN